MGLTQEWQRFREGEPGRRFVEEHDRVEHQHGIARFAAGGVGILLIGAGVVMLFIPGPGIVTIVFGLALVATTWRRLASWLDLGELRLREWRRER